MSKNPTREEIEHWFQYWDRTTLIERMFANEARIKELEAEVERLELEMDAYRRAFDERMP